MKCGLDCAREREREKASERGRRKEGEKTCLLDPVPVDRRLRAQKVDELDDDAVPGVGVDGGARVLAVDEDGVDLEAVGGRLRFFDYFFLEMMMMIVGRVFFSSSLLKQKRKKETHDSPSPRWRRTCIFA